MLNLFQDALIGRKVRKAMAGIQDQERFAVVAPLAIVSIETERGGAFEITVGRPIKGDGSVP